MEILDLLKIKLNYPESSLRCNDSYLADISGSDSIAALIKILETQPGSVIIPSVAEVACEYGDKTQFRNVLKIIHDTFAPSSSIMQCVIFDANELWKKLIVSQLQQMVAEHNFFSPCIACHLSFHLARIAIAKHLGIARVISGERELHNNAEKINQFDIILDYFNSIYNSVGIAHYLPVRKIANTQHISEIMNKYKINPVSLECLFSKNYYKDGTNELAISKKAVEKYLRCFIPKLLSSIEKEIIINCRVD